MNTKQVNRKVKRIRENYAKMRAEFWPGIPDDLLWHRKDKKGYVHIPRCITFISIIMDGLAENMKISSSYLALWCHKFDESLVIIKDQEAMAFESGFINSQRAVNTWKMRMKELDRLGFIKTASGPSGPYNYVLILNPYKIIKQHREKGDIPIGANYNALFARAVEVGADEDL